MASFAGHLALTCPGTSHNVYLQLLPLTGVGLLLSRLVHKLFDLLPPLDTPNWEEFLDYHFLASSSESTRSTQAVVQGMLPRVLTLNDQQTEQEMYVSQGSTKTVSRTTCNRSSTAAVTCKECVKVDSSRCTHT